MYIYEQYDNSLFRSRFKDYDRVGEGKNFSWRGVDLLFEYLEQLAEDLGEPIELDVIGICCDFAEYSSEELYKEFAEQNETQEELEERLMNEGRIAIQRDDIFIIQD